MIFLKVKQPLAAHFPKLQGQPAALDPKIVRKLLPRKRYVKFISSQTLGFGRKIGHELCPGGALPHVGELFAETKIFPGKLAQQVADDPAVMRAGGGADGQNALYVQKHCGNGSFGHHTHIQPGAGGAGECGGKGLPRPGFGKNVAVPPDILLYDENASRQHKADGFRRIPGAQQKSVLREVPAFCLEAGEHGGQLLLRNAGKELGGTDHG